MKYISTGLVLFTLLAGCDGTNPLYGIEADNDADLETAGDETAKQSIERYEPQNGTAGYASEIEYNASKDTFSVNNLGFDGANVYKRGEAVATMGTFKVFDGVTTVNDSVTGTPIEQFQHRAIFGRSSSGKTEFGIVRTGAYVSYGFGGYMYARKGGVTLPTKGQAAFEGKYAGIRIFDNQTGTEFTEADMTVAIDFRDFDEGSAIQGSIYNRVAYDIDGGVLPTGTGEADLKLPPIIFHVGPGVLAANGVIEGDLSSFITNAEGALDTFETGKYYGILSGDDPDELVGVVVVESDDPRAEGVKVQETGGFILYR